jgi:hypothetical protein
VDWQFAGEFRGTWYQSYTKAKNPGDPGDFQVQQGLAMGSRRSRAANVQ